jgi:hypothetical protein
MAVIPDLYALPCHDRQGSVLFVLAEQQLAVLTLPNVYIN